MIVSILMGVSKLSEQNVIFTCNKQRLPEIMTKEELLKFGKAIKRTDVAMAVWISVFHGLRLGELAEGDNKNWHPDKKKWVITKTDPLKWENVSFEKSEIKIVNAKNTKRFKSGYGKDRIVPIPKELIGIWKRWRLLNPEAVFVIPDSKDKTKAISKRVLQEYFSGYLQNTGLLKVHYYTKDKRPRYSFKFHTSRHMFGVLMIRKGVTIEKLQKLMGHAQIDTTMLYTKLAITDLHHAVNKAISVKKEINEMGMAKELVKAMMNEMMEKMAVVKNE